MINCLFTFSMNLNVFRVFVAASLLMLGTLSHAVVYQGASGSNDVITIDYPSGGINAEVSVTSTTANRPAIKETWLASPLVDGFSLTAPAASALKNIGVKVEYRQVNKNSTLYQCTAGCGSTVPYLISVKK
jgi:hypothetical protein